LETSLVENFFGISLKVVHIESKKLAEEPFDTIIYICSSVQEISRLETCNEKAFGPVLEHHHFNRLLKLKKINQKTCFITFNSELINPKNCMPKNFFKFPKQLNECLEHFLNLEEHIRFFPRVWKKCQVLFIERKFKEIKRNGHLKLI
jgi:hypothetical protein